VQLLAQMLVVGQRAEQLEQQARVLWDRAADLRLGV
jgi:DNA-directed RNA polymerase subunit K/omega